MTAQALTGYETGFDVEKIFDITISGLIFRLKNALSGSYLSFGTLMIQLGSSYHKDHLVCVRTNVFHQVVGKYERLNPALHSS